MGRHLQHLKDLPAVGPEPQGPPDLQAQPMRVERGKAAFKASEIRQRDNSSRPPAGRAPASMSSITAK